MEEQTSDFQVASVSCWRWHPITVGRLQNWFGLNVLWSAVGLVMSHGLVSVLSFHHFNNGKYILNSWTFLTLLCMWQCVCYRNEKGMDVVVTKNPYSPISLLYQPDKPITVAWSQVRLYPLAYSNDHTVGRQDGTNWSGTRLKSLWSLASKNQVVNLVQNIDMELHRFYVYVLKIDSGLHAVSVFCLVFVSLSRDLLFCNSLASIDPSRALSVWTIFVSQKKKNYV